MRGYSCQWGLVVNTSWGLHAMSYFFFYKHLFHSTHVHCRYKSRWPRHYWSSAASRGAESTTASSAAGGAAPNGWEAVAPPAPVDPRTRDGTLQHQSSRNLHGQSLRNTAKGRPWLASAPAAVAGAAMHWRPLDPAPSWPRGSQICPAHRPHTQVALAGGLCHGYTYLRVHEGQQPLKS